MFRRWMYFSLMGCLSFSSLARAAEPGAAIWGVFRCSPDEPNTCEHLSEVERSVEKRLQELAVPQSSLIPGGAASLAACAPEKCAQQLRDACPTGQGRVLGAIVQQKKTLTQIRTWLYDINLKRLAVHDDYCQSCVLTNAVVAQASALLEHPSFDTAAPSAIPIYCQRTGVASARTASRTSNKIAVVIIGEARQKNALRESIKDHLRILGRQSVFPQVERKQLGIEELRRLLDGDKNAQVLVIEATPQGADLSLFDGATELTEPQNIACEGCDARQLTDKVKTGSGVLLDHCFGEGCAGADTRSAPPPEACSPFPVPGGVSLGAPISSEPGYQIDPRFAKRTKGALWGLFAATAATSISLAIANSFVKNYYDIQGVTPDNMPIVIRNKGFDNILANSAWTAAGISVGILAVNIPLTIALNRATPAHRELSTTKNAVFQCQM